MDFRYALSYFSYHKLKGFAHTVCNQKIIRGDYEQCDHRMYTGICD